MFRFGSVPCLTTEGQGQQGKEDYVVPIWLQPPPQSCPAVPHFPLPSGRCRGEVSLGAGDLPVSFT